MKNVFDTIEGFQWDEGNIEKNWIKHQVFHIECEQIFFNEPIIIADDVKHSQKVKRWFALGRTDSNRRIFVVFTIRESLIRIITARDMTKNERRKYDEEIKKHTKI